MDEKSAPRSKNDLLKEIDRPSDDYQSAIVTDEKNVSEDEENEKADDFGRGGYRTEYMIGPNFGEGQPVARYSNFDKGHESWRPPKDHPGWRQPKRQGGYDPRYTRGYKQGRVHGQQQQKSTGGYGWQNMKRKQPPPRQYVQRTYEKQQAPSPPKYKPQHQSKPAWSKKQAFMKHVGKFMKESYEKSAPAQSYQQPAPQPQIQYLPSYRPQQRQAAKFEPNKSG